MCVSYPDPTAVATRPERGAGAAAITDLESHFSPATLDARRQTRREGRRHPLRTRQRAPGYAIVHHVTADYYQGTSPAPWRTVSLSPA